MGDWNSGYVTDIGYTYGVVSRADAGDTQLCGALVGGLTLRPISAIRR